MSTIGQTNYHSTEVLKYVNESSKIVSESLKGLRENEDSITAYEATKS